MAPALRKEEIRIVIFMQCSFLDKILAQRVRSTRSSVAPLRLSWRQLFSPANDGGLPPVGTKTNLGFLLAELLQLR